MSPAHHELLEEPAPDYSGYPDRIANSYAGKTIFITGGTGYVGKALVERILHNTEVKKLYLLIKSKKNMSPSERFAKYFEQTMFRMLMKEKPEMIQRVELMTGDVTELNLGLSQEDRMKVIEEVDYVYHSAATVRFDEPLKKAILLNVRGTKYMVALAREIKKLKLFCFISTTYCMPCDVYLEEEPIQPEFNPHELIRIAENVDENALNALTPHFCHKNPTTYALSKGLAEAIVYEQRDNLPILVVRPSVILPAWKLPEPGFTDNINGPLGHWVAYGKGILRVTNVGFDIHMNYTFLDTVINVIMISSYNYIEDTSDKTMVIHAHSLRFNNRFHLKNSNAAFEKVPLKLGMGHPWVMVITCPFLFNIAFIVLQLLPALLMDGVGVLVGKKPFLTNIMQKLARAQIFLKDYILNDNWKFKNEKVGLLRLNLNPREDDAYALNTEDWDSIKWSCDALELGRVDVLGEKKEDLPRNARNRKIMMYVHYFFVGCLLLSLMKFTYYNGIPLLIRFAYYIFDV